MKIVFYLYLFTLCNSFLHRFLPKKTLNPVIQIGFLHGSNIPIDFYQPFLQDLTSKLKFDVNITNYTYFPLQSTMNNTIMVGHSFGGTISLLYCITTSPLCHSTSPSKDLINPSHIFLSSLEVFKKSSSEL